MFEKTDYYWAGIHQALLSQSSPLVEILIGKDYDSGGKCNLGESRHCRKRVKDTTNHRKITTTKNFRSKYKF